MQVVSASLKIKHWNWKNKKHMPLGNTWITANRTEREKKRSYAEIVYNLKGE